MMTRPLDYEFESSQKKKKRMKIYLNTLSNSLRIIDLIACHFYFSCDLRVTFCWFFLAMSLFNSL